MDEVQQDTVFSRYVKDPKMTPKRKELLIYMLERIGREDGGKITIIFDCQSAGVRFLSPTRDNPSPNLKNCSQECGDRGNPVHHAGEKSCGGQSGVTAALYSIRHCFPLIFSALDASGVAKLGTRMTLCINAQVLIHYYPNLVRRIIVLEMPWVMNTVWRLVKSLLPGPAQDMIKFCTKVEA